MTQQEITTEIALGSQKLGSIEIRPADPFTWTSGRKSPIYNDNRLALSDPHLRGVICDAFCKKINDLLIDDLVIAGTATAGIPWAAIVAAQLELPMVYIRGEAKAHGKGKRIEGLTPEAIPGTMFVLIDDLFSTGKSAADAAQAIIDAGGTVTAILSIFTYGFPEVARMFNGEIPFNGSDHLSTPCRFDSLLTYSELLKIGVLNGFISADEKELLDSWSANAQDWSDQYKMTH